MRYRHFEVLVLAVGGTTIFGSLFLTPGIPVMHEVIAQLMLLGVLFSALKWGRAGGFVAAIVASLVYVVIRVPLVIEADGLTSHVVTLLMIRIATYGMVGIVGGELCGRIKYLFAKLEGGNAIDDWSQIYNQRGIARALDSASGQFARYDTPYSVVTLEVSQSITENLRESKQRAVVREIAKFVRNNIRLVDEAGRLDDGRFVVVLPQTDAAGARSVVNRLREGVVKLLGAKDESVIVESLSAPEDEVGLSAFQSELTGRLAEVAADDQSLASSA